MKISMYQIDPNRDDCHAAGADLDAAINIHGDGKIIDSSLYDEVYTGFINSSSFEDIYGLFNREIPEDYRGHPLSVSDVLCVRDSDTISDGFYYCDAFGFPMIDFNPEKTQKAPHKINVVMCLPGKKAFVTQIKATIAGYQRAVGGDFKPLLPLFYDGNKFTAVIGNAESKLFGTDFNRFVYNEDGSVLDAVFGPFFVCDASGDTFDSLDEERLSKYSLKLLYPEMLQQTDGKIIAVQYIPVSELNL